MPGRRLTAQQRETIERCWAGGFTQARIAVAVGVHPSTVSREIRRNGGGDYGPRHPLRRGPKGTLRPAYRCRYSARTAQTWAARRACRPRLGKLALAGPLRDAVVAGLTRRWSPEQIAGRLRYEYPDQPEMWVSAETIYLAVYLEPRGGLKKLLGTAALRSGRTSRHRPPPHGKRARFADLPHISTRPAEADDRAVPGHHEGDLLIGAAGRSGIATVVERATRFTTLVALPDGHRDPGHVAARIAAKICDMPADLRRSLTWDRGLEMAHSHARFSIATGCRVYFTDPHSPWQRGTNENTNGLLRQYFPKGRFDFTTIDQIGLDTVAAELNGRPRRVLGWRTPAEAFDTLLTQHHTTS